MPYLPGMKIFDEQLVLKDESGTLLKKVGYELELESGRIVTGVTDEDGKTERIESTEPLKIQNLKIIY
ncbi:hypothetical protein [Chromobacterium phragmitis]